MSTCVLYLDEVMHPTNRTKVIDQVCKKISEKSPEFDSIAVTGLSGLLVGPEVASRLNKELIVVRKSPSHSEFQVEASCLPEQFIILDDHINSSKTVKRILRKTLKRFPESICVQIILYGSFSDFKFPDIELRVNKKTHKILVQGVLNRSENTFTHCYAHLEKSDDAIHQNLCIPGTSSI